MAAMDSPRPGGQLAHYRILEKLGAGGMGEVYRARDESLDRDVAIKVLPASFDAPDARARLVREARAAAALNHPHICTVYEVGDADGQGYIAMELVEGQTLGAKLEAGALPVDQAVRYGLQLADAVAHAHDRGVVHRDLKSANVIVSIDGRLKVLDFGLAKRLSAPELNEAVTHFDATFTQDGTVMGTLPYMAPEQLRGQIAQASSDVWALGVVLYEMLQGSRPFKGQTGFELSAAILHQTPDLGSIPSALQAVISRCLEKEPGQRYKSGGEVRAALEMIQAGVQSAPTPVIAPLPVAGGVPAIHLPPLLRLGVFWQRRRHRLQLRARLRSGRRARLERLARVAAVVAVAAGAYAVWQFWPTTVRALAVLPFDNTAGDEDLQYLCEGISESLIRQTSKLPSLRVSNLNTVLSFSGRAVDPSVAGRQLGVESVLAGSLERQGTRLHISARLIDVATGRQLWSNTYNRDAADLLDVQDEIASAILNDGLRLRLTSDERQQLVRHPTTDGDAYDLFLQARFIQRRATEEDYLYSRELLRRALVRDANFALAYAALSGNYAMMVTDGLERPTDAWPQVNKYGRQALMLDPTLPEALAMEHAVAFLFDWDWAGAERARRRFLESPVGDYDPQVARAMSTELWALGRADEALQLARRTRELDPRSPYLAILEADYLLRTDQFEAAVGLYQHVIGVEPDNLNAYFGLAEALYRLKRFDDAVEARRKAHEVAGDDVLKDVLATARGEEGYRAIDQAWVRLQIEALKTRETTAYVSPLDYARAYAQLGQKDLAFKYLDASFADRSPGLVFLKVDRAWDSVRGEPRFLAAVQRVGLP